MPTFRTGTVTGVLSERAGIQRVSVRMDGDAAAADGSRADDARAYALTDLVGSCAVGDEIVCNTTAVDLGLGTGGWHVVHWNLARRELQQPGPDHVMKLRYTSLQTDVGTSELEHAEAPSTLDGTPVVICQVHSQVGVVAAAIGAARPGTRVVYVMTDGASLPIVLSDLVVGLRSRGLLQSTVTAGHAFGGDLEAVTPASALALAAHVADAEIIIVGMGPGVVGTGTPLGTTAIEAAPLIDTVTALGGTPVLCVRASSGDARTRHLGVSHHTITALELARSTPLVGALHTDVVLADAEAQHQLEHDLQRLAELATVIDVEVPDIAAVLAAAELSITTMGRGIDADRLFFDAAAAAGALAAARVGVGAP